ncbi:MAG: hypothetical protein CMP51_00780 [Flavobacteriales bacterium]|nr:hypothetical protein [Flavobacteriales bacterium]|tara:strand:- start:1065 stop:2024 length:960 start_codon:yes stop_codon:yes gene_type:complete
MKKTILILVSLLVFSCENMETVVNIDIPTHDPVLVLNSIIDTDTEVKVMVSHSVGAFEQIIPSCITDAQVLLFENNQFLDTLMIDLVNTDTVLYYTEMGEGQILMNSYISDIIPNSGSTYEIIVNHPDYETITASTYLPQDIIINDIYVDTLGSDDLIGLSFNFDDNANQKNYYRLRIFSRCFKTFFDEYGYEDEFELFGGYAYMLSNDPSFPADIPYDGYTFEGTKVTFTDDLFDGQTKNISIDIDPEGFKYSDCDTVIIELSTFSNDTYSYYNSLGDHREKGELGIFGGEVLPVYSNVENGLGILISLNAQNIQVKP